jgi:hypothetical protein
VVKAQQAIGPIGPIGFLGDREEAVVVEVVEWWRYPSFMLKIMIAWK